MYNFGFSTCSRGSIEIKHIQVAARNGVLGQCTLVLSLIRTLLRHSLYEFDYTFRHLGPKCVDYSWCCCICDGAWLVPILKSIRIMQNL